MFIHVLVVINTTVIIEEFNKTTTNSRDADRLYLVMISSRSFQYALSTRGQNSKLQQWSSILKLSRKNVLSCRYLSNTSSNNSNSGSDSGTEQQNANAKKTQEVKTSKSFHSKFMNPIVGQLWDQRQLSKQRLMSLSDSDSETTGSGNLQELTAISIHKGKEDGGGGKHPKFKPPSASKTTIDYPFSRDDFLREAYCSPGGTMRFGKILEDLDALAGNIAFHHVVGNPMLVTAAVDRIAIRDVPRLEKDQRLSGQVTWVGNSSMEIRMQLHEASTSNHRSSEHWLEAYFTFVAVDPETKKPTKICQLQPETAEERALFDLGALKAAQKKQIRNRGIYSVGKHITEEDVNMEKRAEQLLEEAFPLLHMPSLSDPQSILMKNTMLQNTLIAQPQARNLANRIFGGFLMRRAFELSFSTAYCFGGEYRTSSKRFIMFEFNQFLLISYFLVV